MDFVTMIASAQAYLDQFDYDHYPDCFAAFEEDCAKWFAEHGALAAESETERILEQFEARWAQLPRRERREAAYRDKQVLALFYSPAAARISEEAGAFSETLREKWNARFPRNTFLPGRFEEILKGFDANLLGLPLRKSKKNR